MLCFFSDFVLTIRSVQSQNTYFHDPHNMYKRYPMSECMPESKFRIILGAFKSSHDKGGRRKLNALMRELRRSYAGLLYDKANSIISLDEAAHEVSHYTRPT